MIRTVNLGQFAGQMSKLPDVGVVVREIDQAKPYPAVNFGHLRQSVRYRPIPGGGEITIDAPHAVFMEEGTRPFWPPKWPLILWMVRKGLAEDEDEAEQFVFAIQRKIANEGIEPRFFFAKAMAEIEGRLVRTEIESELRRLANGSK